MKKTMRLALFLCVLFMTSTTDAAYRTFCEAPTVKASESATLTFFFPEDVQEKRDSFCVYRTDSTGQNKDTVVACNWLKDGTTDCFLKDGVHVLSKTVKHELLVKFDHVQNGTRFSCDTVPRHANTEVDDCPVFIEDESDEKSNEPSTLSSEEKDPVLSVSVLGAEAVAGNQGASPFLIASIVANVIFVVFIVVAAAVLIRRRRLARKEEPQDKASTSLMHV